MYVACKLVPKSFNLTSSFELIFFVIFSLEFSDYTLRGFLVENLVGFRPEKFIHSGNTICESQKEDVPTITYTEMNYNEINERTKFTRVLFEVFNYSLYTFLSNQQTLKSDLH